jgi:hypothetical protein
VYAIMRIATGNRTTLPDAAVMRYCVIPHSCMLLFLCLNYVNLQLAMINIHFQLTRLSEEQRQQHQQLQQQQQQQQLKNLQPLYASQQQQAAHHGKSSSLTSISAHDTDTATSATAAVPISSATEQQPLPLLSSPPLFQYRHPRRFPGAALYRVLDDARLVLQIHDELLFEVQERHLDEVRILQ